MYSLPQHRIPYSDFSSRVAGTLRLVQRVLNEIQGCAAIDKETNKAFGLYRTAGTTLMGAEKTVHDFTLNSIDGQPTALSSFKGKVLLLVNVASRSGYTPQSAALESLYEKYKDWRFMMVGIPANNFGAQEPGTNQEIKTFCTSKYHVSFPMMAKASVKGSDSAPLYQFLTDKTANPMTGGVIAWNFTKFLVDGDGKVVERFESGVNPDSPEVSAAIEKALGRRRP